MTPQRGPLAGYRVLELGSTVAGPFCGRLLADFGAEVIKVEPPEGDAVRAMGKHADGKSLYAATILRNKQLIALDLRRPEARDVVKRLIPKCDVVVENFRPGTLEKWGIGFAALRAINPGLVMVRISGFGQTGPYRDRPGYGFLGDAVGGLLHINGYPDRPPVRAAVPVTDMITGIYGAFGAVMALLSRKDSGQGQVVDAALYESSFSLMESHVPAYEKLGEVAMRAGSNLPGSTPNSLYPTADGGFIAMAAASDAVFRRLTTAMGQPALADDPRFSAALSRVKNEEALDRVIGEWTIEFPLDELEPLLRRSDVPASRVFTMADIFHDPHFAAREAIVNVGGGEWDSIAMAAPVPKLSETPGHIHHAGGEIGADTVDVLTRHAGMSAREIEALLDAGIVFDADHARARAAAASTEATNAAAHADPT
ncbi:MAG: CaiB/BaiF CoA-transferase family protein [Casimicrobiaceae bacterium]